MSEPVRFILYVNGQSDRAQRAIRDLERICRENFADAFELTTIDVLARPEEAERDKILATPTLVKLSPLPIRRLVGDLSDEHRVLTALDMSLPHRET